VSGIGQFHDRDFVKGAPRLSHVIGEPTVLWAAVMKNRDYAIIPVGLSCPVSDRCFGKDAAVRRPIADCGLDEKRG